MSTNIDLKTIWVLLKDTYLEWSEDKAPRLGAALAYYTLFSIAPLLIIVIAIVGFVFGQQAVQGEIVDQIGGWVGEGSAKAIQTMIESAREPTSGIVATVVGVLTLLFGATGVFSQLKDALNTVWDVTEKPRGSIMGFIIDRLLAFLMVLVIGFLLLIFLALSAGISALSNYINALIPGFSYVLQVLNFVISFAAITLLFAVIYRVLPDTNIAWGDVWIGAAVTSLLFTIGKTLIGFYLGHVSAGSAYGAAGSLVVLLIWIYYSAQIFFFGAEFTQVYARKYGSLSQVS
ncbi:MAG TPA: YihY/virulence factor BrkB family protein [Thermodesulfobacteriota bacterium]|nr:YihY/virulence factor BrkB family protein [Thermodesulfobacteriota bacterium]